MPKQGELMSVTDHFITFISLTKRVHRYHFRKTYRKWNKMDYLFYDHINQSLWKQIKDEGKDFWEELKYFRAVKQNVSDFCHEVLISFASEPIGPTAFRYVAGTGQFIRLGNRGLHTMFRGKLPFEMGGERMSRFSKERGDNPFRGDDDSDDDDDYDRFYKHKNYIPRTKLKIPASKWSPAFTFDAERCMGMYFNPLVFKNLLRIRQHPHLCKALNNIKAPPPPTPNPKKPQSPLHHRRLQQWWKLNLESFDPKTKRQAIFHPAYCSKPKATKHRFSKEIIFARNAYGFSYVHKG